MSEMLREALMNGRFVGRDLNLQEGALCTRGPIKATSVEGDQAVFHLEWAAMLELSHDPHERREVSARIRTAPWQLQPNLKDIRGPVDFSSTVVGNEDGYVTIRIGLVGTVTIMPANDNLPKPS